MNDFGDFASERQNGEYDNCFRRVQDQDCEQDASDTEDAEQPRENCPNINFLVFDSEVNDVVESTIFAIF